MTAADIKKRLTEIANGGYYARADQLADVVIDLLDWVQGGDPACQHEWTFYPSKEDVLVSVEVCGGWTVPGLLDRISKEETDFDIRNVTYQFELGDRIKLVRERAAKPE